MKKILSIFICLVMIVNVVKAADDSSAGVKWYKYDCSLAASNIDDLLKSLKNSISNFKVFKEDDIKLAHQHLKSYCCKKWFLGSDCDGWWSNTPESPYLFDQLIDVWFRKLDGDPNLSYGGQLDSDGKQRREEVRKLAKDPQWKNPGEILDLFNKYRDVKQTWTDKLSVKYNDTCEESRVIKMSFPQVFDDESLDAGYSQCLSIASSRVNGEMTYVNYVMVYKWIKYLKDAIHNYLMDYFLKEKSMMVLEKLSEVQWKLWQWVQKVNWAQNCNWWSR